MKNQQTIQTTPSHTKNMCHFSSSVTSTRPKQPNEPSKSGAWHLANASECQASDLQVPRYHCWRNSHWRWNAPWNNNSQKHHGNLSVPLPMPTPSRNKSLTPSSPNKAFFLGGIGRVPLHFHENRGLQSKKNPILKCAPLKLTARSLPLKWMVGR